MTAFLNTFFLFFELQPFWVNCLFSLALGLTITGSLKIILFHFEDNTKELPDYIESSGVRLYAAGLILFVVTLAYVYFSLLNKLSI